MVTRSITPANFSSAPIGIWIGTGCPSGGPIARRLEERRADAVHLVDEARRGTRYLLPGARRSPTALHTGDRVINHAGAVEHAHRALDFDGEVDVARGVDDVDVCSG